MKNALTAALTNAALVPLLLTVTLVAADTAKAQQLARPDFSIYHSKLRTFEALGEIVQRNPSSFKVDSLSAGDEKYFSTLQVITVEPGGLSDNHSDKLRLLLDFGEHGRELVTVEVALRLLQLLADPEKTREVVAARGGNSEKLLRILERCVFKIIPMENTHGRDIVENGTLCERKNGRGVDSNRNWPVHWGFREKDYDPSEEYPGEAPFSEPEVQMLNKLAQDFQPHVWMNMHSGMEALFMPYDHVAAIPDDQAGLVSLSLLQTLNELKCSGKCAVGSGGKSVGYLAHGTATDYMHDVVGVPFGFTWEIYGDLAANFQDCFRMFNPLSNEQLEQVVSNWADAVLAMVELLPSSHKTDTSLAHRKMMPMSFKDKQQFNHTDTDIAAARRAERLLEVFASLTQVERELGVDVPHRHLGAVLSGVPQTAWVALFGCALLLAGLLIGRGVLGECTVKGKSRASRRRHAAVL